jgi:hypothetical protein
MMIAAQMLSRSASSLRGKTTDGRVLPAKFSPSLELFGRRI